MDGIQGPSRIVSTPLVHDRQGGGKQDAEAFRRALQEHGDGTAAQPEPPPKPPLRRALQRPAPDGRKDGETAHHVDVVA